MWKYEHIRYYEEAQKYPFTHDREYTEEELWVNLEYWIKIITPIAEEEGIRLGIHPSDPPVPVLGGIPQILRSFNACFSLSFYS